MNRRDLVNELRERMEVDRKTADEWLSQFVETITDTVRTGEPVIISGFAKFARVDRPARMGRNPQTGEAIKIAASRKCRITALKAFKDAVNSGRAVKKVVRKPAPKKTAVRKTAATKTVARRPVAKKTVAKKTVAKKAPARKPAAAKKATKRR